MQTLNEHGYTLHVLEDIKHRTNHREEMDLGKIDVIAAMQSIMITEDPKSQRMSALVTESMRELSVAKVSDLIPATLPGGDGYSKFQQLWVSYQMTRHHIPGYETDINAELDSLVPLQDIADILHGHRCAPLVTAVVRQYLQLVLSSTLLWTRIRLKPSTLYDTAMHVLHGDCDTDSKITGTDGSVSDGRATIGVAYRNEDGVSRVGARIGGLQEINRAELCAMQMALHDTGIPDKEGNVLAFDSNNAKHCIKKVIDSINGKYRLNKLDNRSVAYAAAHRYLDREHKVKWRKVKSHEAENFTASRIQQAKDEGEWQFYVSNMDADQAADEGHIHGAPTIPDNFTYADRVIVMKDGWLVEHQIRQTIHDQVAELCIQRMETAVQRKWQSELHECWTEPTNSLQLSGAKANVKRFQLQLVTGSLAESQTNKRRYATICPSLRTADCVFGCRDGQDSMSHYFRGTCTTVNLLSRQIQQQAISVVAQHIKVPTQVVAKYIKPWLPGYKRRGSPRIYGHRALMAGVIPMKVKQQADRMVNQLSRLGCLRTRTSRITKAFSMASRHIAESILSAVWIPRCNAEDCNMQQQVTGMRSTEVAKAVKNAKYNVGDIVVSTRTNNPPRASTTFGLIVAIHPRTGGISTVQYTVRYEQQVILRKQTEVSRHVASTLRRRYNNSNAWIVLKAPIGHSEYGQCGHTSAVLQRYDVQRIVMVWGNTATIENVNEVAKWEEIPKGDSKLAALRRITELAATDIGFIGTRISRRDKKWDDGKVTYHGVISGRRGRSKWLQVTYMDGDVEELSPSELREHGK